MHSESFAPFAHATHKRSLSQAPPPPEDQSSCPLPRFGDAVWRQSDPLYEPDEKLLPGQATSHDLKAASAAADQRAATPGNASSSRSLRSRGGGGGSGSLSCGGTADSSRFSFDTTSSAEFGWSFSEQEDSASLMPSVDFNGTRNLVFEDGATSVAAGPPPIGWYSQRSSSPARSTSRSGGRSRPGTTTSSRQRPGSSSSSVCATARPGSVGARHTSGGAMAPPSSSSFISSRSPSRSNRSQSSMSRSSSRNGSGGKQFTSSSSSTGGGVPWNNRACTASVSIHNARLHPGQREYFFGPANSTFQAPLAFRHNNGKWRAAQSATLSRSSQTL
jgi:hypothetical protein